MTDEATDRSKENGMAQRCTKEERTEYFARLEKWLQEAYTWQSIATMMPYCMLSGQTSTVSGVTPLAVPLPNIGVSSSRTDSSQPSNDGRQTRPQDATGPPAGVEGYEYRIPPIWKRFAAEFIDSIMLFLLKIFTTYVAIDIFHIVDMNDKNILQAHLLMDYKMALEMTSEILILELVHRVTVCLYEAFWLRHGLNGRVGGATLGKILMGLRVVKCYSVTPIERPDDSQLVFVSPGTDLGLPLALGRSAIKNLILTFLFPICFTLFFFKFYRTGYDLTCNAIVVEDPHPNNRPRRR